jgi:hypothetical protein
VPNRRKISPSWEHKNTLHTGVRDTDRQQFVENIGDYFDGMIARLVCYGIPYKAATASQSRGTPYFGMIIVEIWKCACSDDVIEDVTCEYQVKTDTSEGTTSAKYH